MLTLGVLKKAHLRDCCHDGPSLCPPPGLSTIAKMVFMPIPDSRLHTRHGCYVFLAIWASRSHSRLQHVLTHNQLQPLACCARTTDQTSIQDKVTDAILLDVNNSPSSLHENEKT